MRTLLALATWLLIVAPAAGTDEDPTTGLIIAPGWELVRSYCGACHSYRMVTAQRGDARFWTDTIRWMQRTQSLMRLESAQERAMVDYLARNYDEVDWGRRPPLGPALLPEPLR